MHFKKWSGFFAYFVNGCVFGPPCISQQFNQRVTIRISKTFSSSYHISNWTAKRCSKYTNTYDAWLHAMCCVHVKQHRPSEDWYDSHTKQLAALSRISPRVRVIPWAIPGHGPTSNCNRNGRRPQQHTSARLQRITDDLAS